MMTTNACVLVTVQHSICRRVHTLLRRARETREACWNYVKHMDIKAFVTLLLHQVIHIGSR